MRIPLNFEEEETDNLDALDRRNNIINRPVQETDTHSHANPSSQSFPSKATHLNCSLLLEKTISALFFGKPTLLGQDLNRLLLFC